MLSSKAVGNLMPRGVSQRTHLSRFIERGPQFRFMRNDNRRDSLLRFKPELAPDPSVEGLNIPIEAQQLLGFKAGSVPKNNEINQAYQDLLAVPPLEGYSRATLDSRAALLEVAKADVIGSKSQATSERLHSITVPFHLVPGALAVLVEVGQSDQVLELGHELLLSRELEGHMELKNDVLLSMAMACCNLAGDALEQENQASAACTHLEDALSLLQGPGGRGASIAPHLVSEIRGSLRSLRVPSIQEELLGVAGKPGAESSPEGRKRAIRSLRELLKDAAVAPPSTALALQPDTTRGLVGALSCEEVVHLMEWEAVARSGVKAHSWLYPGLLRNVAVAHIVTGYRQRQPTYIKMAASIIKHAMSSGPRQTMPPVSSDMLLIQGVCQLLLGEIQSATALIKQAETTANSGSAEDQWGTGTYAFVVQNSPGGGDDGLLPGLCLMTEKWLNKVAFPLFPDTAASPPAMALSQYFDDTRVEALIAVYDEKDADAGFGSSRARLLTGDEDDSFMEKQRGARGAARQAVQAAVDAIARVVGGVRSTVIGTSDDLLSGSGLGDRLTPKQRSLVLVAGLGLAAAGALAALGGAALNRGGKTDVAQGVIHATTAAPTVVTSSRKSSQAVQRVKAVYGDQMDARVAEQLITNWQIAKQACLGASYDTSALPIVLTGQALSEAQQRATEFRTKGWHMDYKLSRCELDIPAIPASGSPGAGLFGAAPVVISATIDESASLFGKDGRATADYYRSAYQAKYHVVKSKSEPGGQQGAWRISKIVVEEEKIS